MQKNTLNTEDSSDYLYPEQRKAAIERLADLERQFEANPSTALRVLVRKARERVRWYERKKGDRSNVGTTSLCSRPPRTTRPIEAQAAQVPVVGLSALLPPA